MNPGASHLDLLGQAASQPIISELLQLPHFIHPRQISLLLQRQLGACIHDLERHLSVPRRDVDEGHGVGDSAVSVLHTARVDHVAWLVAREYLL